jgi:Mrp family chromosome partitioning ATPase
LPCTLGSIGQDTLALQLPLVLKKAKEDFDVILVDVAPLLAGDEAATVVNSTDAALVVVGVGSATRPLHEAALALESINARVVGVVLNRVRVPRVTYGY